MAFPSPNPNEKLSGSIAGQSFAISTGHLVEVLLILALAGFYYLTFISNNRTFQQLTKGHEQLSEQIADNNNKARTALNSLISMLAIIDHNSTVPAEQQIPLLIECIEAREILEKKHRHDR